MAGESSRFRKAGFDVPKFQLDLDGRPVFDYAVMSFKARFEEEPFLFITLRDQGTPEFVRKRIASLGIKNAELVVLDNISAGQAATVDIGLENAGVGMEEPITVFNIDSFRRGFSMTSFERKADGYLEVFRGSGQGWSFVLPSQSDQGHVNRVVEKERISDLCCTGLYYFKRRNDFQTAYRSELASPSQSLTEHYIAPIYNQMIARGQQVLYREIPLSDVLFCGVPEEYYQLQDQPDVLSRFK
jgi:NDP-sugar pyrophosphorylase family protein